MFSNIFAKIIEMATRQQLERAQQGKQLQTVKTATGTVVSAVTSIAAQGKTGTGWGSFVSVIGNLGIAAYRFISGQKYQKVVAKEQAAIAKVHGTVEEILGAISNMGFELVERGMRPGTTAFENELVRRLYPSTGYKGQCNADIPAPPPKEKKKSRTKSRTLRPPGPPKPKKLLAYIRGNGTRLIKIPGVQVHPYLQSYWSAQCRNIRDSWIEAYQGKLIEEGRFQELEELESSLKKGTLIARIALGGTGLIFLIIIIYYSMKMET